MPKGIYKRTRPIWNKGLTKETNLSVASTSHTLKGRKGHSSWNKGLTKKTDPRLVKSAETRRLGYITGRLVKRSGTFLGKKHTEETRKKMSIKKLGKKQSEETKKKRADKLRGRVMPKEFGQRISKRMKGKPSINKGLTKETSRHVLAQSIKLANLWKDEKVKSVWLRRMRRAANLRPNRLESLLMQLLDENFKNQWIYTGDGSMIIGGRIPDYSNINGQKAVIELFGDYWHKGDNPQDKIDHYAKYGYSCLVIWEHELNDKQLVINRVKGG